MSKYIYIVVGVCCQIDLVVGYKFWDICRVIIFLNCSFFIQGVGLMFVLQNYFEDVFSKYVVDIY